MAKPPAKIDQNTTANNSKSRDSLIAMPEVVPDGLRDWAAWFFQHAVTTKTNSQREQTRDLNRVIAHLKPFAKWVHSLRPFPLGNPMAKIKTISVTNALEIERALKPSERRRILDVADFLLQTGGRSKSRRRYARAGQ